MPRSAFFVSRLSVTSTSTRMRVALEHRRHDAHLAAEEGHAGAVDEPGLHDQPLAQREGQGVRARPGGRRRTRA